MHAHVHLFYLLSISVSSVFCLGFSLFCILVSLSCAFLSICYFSIFFSPVCERVFPTHSILIQLKLVGFYFSE